MVLPLGLRCCEAQAMRDRRFVAAHRGGPLGRAAHRRLAEWAAVCAEHLPTACGTAFVVDARVREAIDTGRAWARGEVRTGAAMQAAVAAHAAARESVDAAAVAVCRAAGHAAATAHAADHCLGVVIYGTKAVAAAGGSAEAEREWQLAQLPLDLRELIESALERRTGERMTMAKRRSKS